MTLKERFIRVPHLFFLLLLLVQLIPDAKEGEFYANYVIGFAVILEAFFLLVAVFSKKTDTVSEVGKLLGVIEVVLILWVLFGPKLDRLNAKMFPAPGVVFYQLIKDEEPLLAAVKISLRTILKGFLLALVIAIPSGLVLGWLKPVRSTANYVVRFVSSIPPIVYIPYAIAFLPTMSGAKLFIIFIASFWPILSGTMTGVVNIERGILDSAKALGVGRVSMLSHVILPGALPYIFNGANQGLGISFILLTSAEMIAADSTNPGLGFYIWNFSNFANYKRVVPAIFVLGITICLISFIIKKIQDFLLRWRAPV